MPDDFPPDLRRFIDEQIESLAQLEALLLLRHEPQRQWEATEIAKSLYIPPEMAGALLAEFGRRGFATASPSSGTRFAYHTIDAETDNLIDRLATIYRERRVAVISLIYSKPMNKVQTFADAFRLRKES
jgi:hypothetical protein